MPRLRYRVGIEILDPERIKAAIDGTHNIQSLLQDLEAREQEQKKNRVAIFNRNITWKSTPHNLYKVLIDPQFQIVHDEMKGALDALESVENWHFLVELAKANLIPDVLERTQALNKVRTDYINQINISSDLRKNLAKKSQYSLTISDFEPAINTLVDLIKYNLGPSNSQASAVNAAPRRTRPLKHRRTLSTVDLADMERMSQPSARSSSPSSLFIATAPKKRQPLRAGSQIAISQIPGANGNAATVPANPAAGIGAAAVSVSTARGSMFLAPAPKTVSGSGSASPSLSSAGSTPSPQDTATGSPVGAMPASLPLGWMAVAGGSSANRSPKSRDTEPVVVLSV